MNLKHTLIETLPPSIKRLVAIPYDSYQTRRADRKFGAKSFPTAQPDPDAPDHILCLVIDAVRTDAISETTTPYLTSLPGTDAITPGTWTFPAVSSMVTGEYPNQHGAIRQHDEKDTDDRLTLPPRLPQNRPTLTEHLAGAGYETFGGFGHDTPFVALQGRFHKHALFHQVNSRAETVLDAYHSWIQGRERTFAFIHLADPHIPLDPPPSYWGSHDVDRSIQDLQTWRYRTDIDCDDDCQRYRNHRRRLYDATVDYVDDAIADLIDNLNAAGIDPLLFITADHGELLWDHVELDVEHFGGSGCVGHGGTPYEALARVPFRTNADLCLERPISLVDLAPTIADIVGIPFEDTAGYSLTEPVPEDRIPIIEGCMSGFEKKAAYLDDHKLIVSKGDETELGFDLPEERPTELPTDVRDHLHAALPAWPDGSEAGTTVSTVVEDRLDQLGYR